MTTSRGAKSSKGFKGSKVKRFTHLRCLFHRFAVSWFKESVRILISLRSNDCYKVSKFHASEMLVSPLRCFKVSSLTTPPLSKLRLSMSVCEKKRVPKNKLRLCLFAFGRAEVRVAFNDRAERYHSRNLVTERDVIGQCDLIVERASKANLQNS